MQRLSIATVLTLFVLATCRVPLLAWDADRHDGTFMNPVLFADYPDPEIIRAGDWFYMVTTTMHIFPGCPIMRSRDLVNWGMVGYALPDFREGPQYELQGSRTDWQRYARGPWASTLRFHDGVFYNAFISLTEQAFFVCRATNPAGPWTRNRINTLFYDPSLLFDDDGRVYVIHTKNDDPPNHIQLTELTSDLTAIKPDTVTQPIFTPQGYYLEGAHAYKIDGRYIILLTTPGKARSRVHCLRADHIAGPYEERIVLDNDGNFPGFEGLALHQASLIQDAAGRWWSMLFQDRISSGRVPHLEPVTWQDGWPMLGHRGTGVFTELMPAALPGQPPAPIPTSDDFADQTLGLQWGWNHLPDQNAWSLSERPGWLRLRSATLNTDATADLQRVRNHLTQRIQGPWSEATAAIDVSHLNDGDLAGLSVFQKPHAYIGVIQNGHQRHVIMVNDGAVVATSPGTVSGVIFLRAYADAIQHRARFSFSSDGHTFVPLGNELAMDFNLKHFVGNRLGLFCQSTKALGGWIDVDWFHLRMPEPLHDGLVHLRASNAETWSGTTLVRARDGGYLVQAKPGDHLTIRCPTTNHTLSRFWIRCTTGVDGMNINWMNKTTVIAQTHIPTFGAQNWSTVMLTSESPVDNNEVEVQIDGPPDSTCELLDIVLDPRH